MIPLLALTQAWLRAHRRFAELLQDQLGQAMVEYSTITFAILGATAAIGFAAKWPQFGNQTLAQVLYQALQTYVNSVNYALSLAAT